MNATATINNSLDFWKTAQARIHAFLDQRLTDPAMRYAVLNGGKRLRPLLVYAAGQLNPIPPRLLDATAAAVECIHCYSLIHDDLPAMDNDDLRRGKPSCHKAFNEATAILAGDALQTYAFELLANASELSAELRIALIQQLTKAIGIQGMTGGQQRDLSQQKVTTVQELDLLHQLKTGALIRASTVMGGIISGCNETQLHPLSVFADALGLAFQIQDDVLDIEGDTQHIGKPVGSDAAAEKITYPTLIGIDASKTRIANLFEQASAALNGLPLNPELLFIVLKGIRNRNH